MARIPKTWFQITRHYRRVRGKGWRFSYSRTLLPRLSAIALAWWTVIERQTLRAFAVIALAFWVAWIGKQPRGVDPGIAFEVGREQRECFCLFVTPRQPLRRRSALRLPFVRLPQTRRLLRLNSCSASCGIRRPLLGFEFRSSGLQCRWCTGNRKSPPWIVRAPQVLRRASISILPKRRLFETSSIVSQF